MALLLAFVVGGIVAGLFGFVVGVPVLRLSGDYLAIVTLAFGEIVKNFMNACNLGIDAKGLHFSLKDTDSLHLEADGKVLINGAMGITGIKKASTFTIGIVLVVLTLVVNRRTPANPDTHYTADNGIVLDYESAVWPVCEMAEDDTLGHALKLASGTDSDNANYQVVLFQRGDASTYEDYIGQSESDLKSAYGVISPRKVKIQIEGATVTAVRCDIQAYYAVLATVEYDSGDVVYVSGLTKLASISDIVNLVEGVSLT